MEITHANFGVWVSASGEAGSDRVIVYYENVFQYLVDGVLERMPEHRGSKHGGLEPFAIQDFGDRYRFTWDTGACVVPTGQTPAVWNKRFAVWIEGGALVIADTRSPNLVTVTCPEVFSTYASPIVQAGKIWVGGRHGIVSLATSDLEAMVIEGDATTLSLAVTEQYPIRKPDGVVKATILRVTPEGIAVSMRDRQITIPVVAGAEPGMHVTLHDELWRDLFVAIELPGKPRLALYRVVETRTREATITRAPAVDPAYGGVTIGTPLARQAELDRLCSLLGSIPDDEATRSVLVDLLEESGEPYAPHLAELLAGATDDAKRRAALGTLANFLEKIEYRAGLPWAAQLAKSTPKEESIIEAIAADQRLGLFHTLRLAAGADDLYVKLVGSPRARGLRAVDAPNRHVLAALIDGGRTEITHLYNVKLTTRTVIEQLAHATFDRVRLLETETSVAFAHKLFEFITTDELKIFARSPRHLVLKERKRDDANLATPVLAAWARLPVSAITFAGITLARDGARTIVTHLPDAPPKAVAQVRAAIAQP